MADDIAHWQVCTLAGLHTDAVLESGPDSEITLKNSPTTMQNSFEESRFRRQVDVALDKVRTILHTTREPQYPEEVFHKYDDKYMLVDFLTNTALAAEVNCLEMIGLNPKNLGAMREWGKDRSVTLRFKAEERCVFDKSKERKIEGPEHVIETKGVFGKASVSEKVVTTVTDYFYTFSYSFELFAFRGNNPDEKVRECQFLSSPLRSSCNKEGVILKLSLARTCYPNLLPPSAPLWTLT
jgi:hypothetical protein